VSSSIGSERRLSPALRWLLLCVVVAGSFFLFALVLPLLVRHRADPSPSRDAGRALPVHSRQGHALGDVQRLILAVRFTVMDFCG